jgi:tRNA (cytidine/uridine-2'-O-)-methyltransferase
VSVRVALHQPDQPGNVGSVLRLGACLRVGVDLIHPCGFAFSTRAVRRAAMDYGELASLAEHANYVAFRAALPGRLVLLTTRGATALPAARFEPGDTLLLGSESAGAPDEAHADADLRVRIPLAAGARSLNLALSAAIALGEALRQLEEWPE